MIDYKYFDLFWRDSTDKQWIIEYSGGTITNKELFSESIEISESLCSEESLRFGCGGAGMIKFKVADIYLPLTGDTLIVKVVLDKHYDDPFTLGKYKVKSDNLTADKMWREVTAYDAIHDIINSDMAAWYNSILPQASSSVAVRQFRSGLAEYFGLEEIVPDGGLVNDGEIINRTIEPEQISGKDVLSAICEMNGCFARIGRDGKLHYIYLPQAIEGLYPAKDLYPDHAPDHLAQSATGHLYPQSPKTLPIARDRNYIECEYSDFITSRITCLVIRGNENDVGSIYPGDSASESDNTYIIEDNFLLYGKSHADLQRISANIFDKISSITYRPYSLKIRANPCIEVGDPIRTQTGHRMIESYVLSRTISGIQAASDTLVAKGTEKYAENVNSVQRSIKQLKGRTNTLIRTVDETRSELEDLESSTNTRFIQTAEEIRAEASRAQSAEGQLSASISLTASGLNAEILKEKERAQGEEERLSTNISATAEEIRADIIAESSRAKGEELRLSTSISATAEEIRAEVSRAQGAEQLLSSSIAQTASQIALKVSKGDVSSQLSIESGQVEIDSNRLIINSTDFSLGSDGKMHSSGGTIGGWTISNAKIYNAGAGYGECTAVQQSMYGNTYAFVAGASSHSDYSTGNFRVRHDGKTYIDDLVIGHINDELYMYREYQKLEALSAYFGGGYELHVGDGFSQVDIGNLEVQSFVGTNPIFEVAMSDPAITGTYDAVFGQNGRLRKKSESSIRFKHDITRRINPDLDPHGLLGLGIYQFKYNSGYLDNADEKCGKDIIGFIAEDVAEKYPVACIHDEYGRPSNWDARYIIPPLLSLVQEQYKKMKQMKMELFSIRGELDSLKNYVYGGNEK